MLQLLLSAQLVVTNPATAATYFSPEALSMPLSGCGRRAKRPPVSSFEASWYSSVWAAAGEPSLATPAISPSSPTWRLTVVPTWTAPMIFEVTMEVGGPLHLSAKRLSGRGGYDLGKLHDHLSRALTTQEQEQTRRALASVEDTLTCPAKGDVLVMDGTKLILEKKAEGKYLVGQRDQLPGEPLGEVSALFIRLAGW